MILNLCRRILKSLAFRCGYLVYRRNGAKIFELPEIEIFLQPSAVYSGQIAGRGLKSEYMPEILKLLKVASEITLPKIENRLSPGHEASGSVNMWPGEHYRLLAALVEVYRPKTVVEIGTYTGLSFLALSEKLEPGAKLVTFDVIPYQKITPRILNESDFNSKTRLQIVGDLSNDALLSQYESLLKECDLLFVDGPKNGIFEARFWEMLLTKKYLKKGCRIIFDDIRLLKMLTFWKNIKLPKIDLTSFGHYTGTGIVFYG